MTGNSPRQSVFVAVWELVIAAGIVLFWAAFFITGPVSIADPKLEDIYLAFETAFPVADFVLAAVLVLAAAGLLRKRSWGRPCTLIGGGMLVFLGLLDTSFNLLQGIYRLGAVEAILNGAINLLSLGSGISLSFWAGRTIAGGPSPRNRPADTPTPSGRFGEFLRFTWHRSRL